MNKSFFFSEEKKKERKSEIKNNEIIKKLCEFFDRFYYF
jgi:hypothetical protein